MAANLKKKSSKSFSPPPSWHIYKKLPGLVLGFHGCDRSVGEDLLCGRQKQLKPSQNEYDWLGAGTYFWEADPWRAYKFARDASQNTPHISQGKITTPYVVGAVINLGHCCNLLDVGALDEAHEAYRFLEATFESAGKALPANKGRDLAARNLDCAVIEMMHRMREKAAPPLESYDTVRAAFIEGDPLYAGAGFNKKNHIQIAVRNLECIKGYFRLPGL